MVSLTDTARAELDNYFADKQKAPIRVYLNKGSCCWSFPDPGPGRGP